MFWDCSIIIVKDMFAYMTMNIRARQDLTPFERHGIGHLSPSSLALYRAAPALWVLR
jgi:hypothetical protein